MRVLFRRPWRVLAVGLVLLSSVGAIVLALPGSTAADARSTEYFWARHYWRCAFDAVSAATGSGLLLQDFDAAYTETGRRWLMAIGGAGALLFVACSISAMRSVALIPRIRATHPAAVTAGYAIAAIALGVIGYYAGDAEGPGRERAALGWVSAFSSLGWPQRGEALAAWGAAGLGLLGGAWLGAWVLITRLHRSAPGLGRVLLLSALLMVLFHASAAGLLVVSESPRGGAPPVKSDAIASESAGDRWLRAQVQTLLAAGTGGQREPIADRAMGEPGKLILAGANLFGGLGGGAAGGVGFFLVGCAVLPRMRSRRGAPPARARNACRAALLMMIALVVLASLGLLLIDGLVASRYDAPPTLGDALIDGSSAVCGGGLTSGLTERLTSDNLTSGLRLGVNLYCFGMVWMMLMMLLGRVAPLAVLAAWSQRAGRKRDYNHAAPSIVPDVPTFPTRTGDSE